jgi:sensor histidine kinase YesM
MQGRLLYPDVSWSTFWPEALLRTLPCWFILALLVPTVLWISDRIRVTRRSWPVALPLQVLAGVVFVIVHIAASAALIALIRQSPDHTFVSAFRSIFSKYAVMGLFSYASIAAAQHAFRAQAEAHARESSSRELRASLTRAELQALRSQLDPHFLFNALNAISVMALEGERETVVRLLSGLGELLRVSLDGAAAQEVTLAAELELLERYLDLERVRFGDRLEVMRSVEPEWLAARVPSLVLQPLVENAIRHGIARRRGPGRVHIEVARAGDRLRLEVRDSGAGFPEPPAREGIGLANTRARLQQLYGSEQRMELGTAAEGGARVTLEIPLRVLEARPIEGVA